MLALPRAALHLALAVFLLGASVHPAPAASSASSASGSAPSRKAMPTRNAGRPLPPVPGEVIVRFKADAATLRAHALGANAKPEAVSAALARRAAALGTRVGRALEAGEAVGERVQVIRQPGADAAELARRLAADPEVEFAEPNGRQRRLQAVPPNDPLYDFRDRQPAGPDAGQWYLRPPDTTFRSSINVEAAWARGFGSAGVVVAVLDTGVRFEHPDLGRVATGGRLLPGYDFVTNRPDSSISNDGDERDDDPSDPGDWTTAVENSTVGGAFHECDPSSRGAAEDTPSSWHGTATASLVGAATHNAVGMAGTAPGVRVLPVRVLGKCFGRDSDIQAAMRWAAGIHVDGVPDNPQANWAKVINLSLGSTGACSAGYQAVVDELVARGVVIIAAAGNSAGEPVGTPASCNGVIAVGATRHVGTKVGFSDLGTQIAISAPGGNCVNIGENEPCLYPILAALNAGLTTPQASKWSDSYDYTVGTSFSAPLAAGVVGLMFSQNAALTVAQAKTLLQGTARPFPTTGGTAGVPACPMPASGVQQLECYCPNPGAANYPLCGAGMLDAGGAVNAAATGLAVIDVTPGATSALRGQAVSLSSARSVAAAGRSITGWNWTLVSGGGAVSAFTGDVDKATASLTPTAVGTFVVRLTVTETGGSNSTTVSVTVSEPPPAAGSDSGGGATSWPWLLLLALAALALAPFRASPRRP
ncbi:MAG: S8 family serine peptidase [Burkholderiales bacterium]|nr:S8 family serine peptidase [Burkholderiales bacterium]